MKSVVAVNFFVLAMIAAFAGWLAITAGPLVAFNTVGGLLVTFAGSALAAGLILWRGWRRDKWPILLAAELIFINAMALTYAPLVVSDFPQFGVLNWSGKLLSLGFCLIVLVLLPADLRRDTGVFRLPRPESRRAVGIALAIFAALGLALAFSGGEEPGGVAEAALFQLTLPSLSEELLFRGLLLAMFAQVAANRWQWLGAPTGPALLASSLLFGCVHGVLFGARAGFVFDPVALLATGLLGAGLAWVALRGGSVWPAVLAHSLLNATGPLLRLAGVI